MHCDAGRSRWRCTWSRSSTAPRSAWPALQAATRFGISPSQLSIFVLLQLGVYAVMQIPTGILVDRYGPRRLLILAALTMGLAQLLFAVAGSYPVALLARAVLGLGDALTFVSVLWFAAGQFTPRRYPLVGDSVTCAGLPPNNPSFTVAEQLLNVPPPASVCAATSPRRSGRPGGWSPRRASPCRPPRSPAPARTASPAAHPGLDHPGRHGGCLGWRGDTTPWDGAAAIQLEPVPAEQVTVVQVRLATRVQQQTVQPGGLLVDLRNAMRPGERVRRRATGEMTRSLQRNDCRAHRTPTGFPARRRGSSQRRH